MKEKLRLIERELRLVLPFFYKEAMEDYPFEPLDEFDTIEDALVKDVEWIINTNKTLRELGFCDSDWPHHFFVFVHLENTDFYFLNLDEERGEVYVAEKDGDFDETNIADLEVARSMEEYIDSCIAEQEHDAKDQ